MPHLLSHTLMPHQLSHTLMPHQPYPIRLHYHMLMLPQPFHMHTVIHRQSSNRHIVHQLHTVHQLSKLQSHTIMLQSSKLLYQPPPHTPTHTKYGSSITTVYDYRIVILTIHIYLSQVSQSVPVVHHAVAAPAAYHAAPVAYAAHASPLAYHSASYAHAAPIAYAAHAAPLAYSHGYGSAYGHNYIH